MPIWLITGTPVTLLVLPLQLSMDAAEGGQDREAGVAAGVKAATDTAMVADIHEVEA